MLFFLNIILPFVIAIAYFIQLKMSFYFFDQWYIWFPLILALDAIYFLIIGIKNRDKRVISLFLYSLIILVLGFVFTLIITNGYLINIFIIFWPIITFVFLDSVCHQIHQTKRTDFLDLKNVIPYINLLIIFLLTALLFYLNIFLTFPGWSILIIFFISSGIIIFSLLRANEVKFKQSFIYSAILALIFTEILGVLLLLPASFYVLAMVEAVVYYCFTSLFLLSLENKISRKAVFKYGFLSVVILLLALATSQWL